jgi:hypothetical protein
MEILRRSSLPLQIAVVAVAIILTTLMSYQIKHITRYEEGATVVFTVRQSPAPVNASFESVQSLTTTGEVMIQTLTSQDSRTIARRAGGTAAYNAEIINYSNEDFPQYSSPFATLMVQGPTLDGVRATFKIVIDMLKNGLYNYQVRADVQKAQRITVFVMGDTGPVVEKPSHVRAYTALCLLSVIGTGMFLIFIRRLLPNGRARPFTGNDRAVRGARHRWTVPGKVSEESLEDRRVNVGSKA